MPKVLVVPVEDGFAVKLEDVDDAVSVHATEEDALEAGRAAARTEEADLVVLDEAGSLRWEEAFGRDAGAPASDEPAAGP